MPDISITDLAEQYTAQVRESVPIDAMPQFFDRAFHAVMDALQRQGMAPTGPPFALYYGMPTETVDLSAGFPTEAAIQADGDVRPGTLPGGTTYETVHIGPYDTMEADYDALMQRMTADGVVPADVMWEQYLSDPMSEPDPAAWRTRICWPVRS